MNNEEQKPRWLLEKERADRLMPEIKRIIAMSFSDLMIRDGTAREDQTQNTDLVLEPCYSTAYRIINGYPFAVRTRRWADIHYCDEITIRSRLKSGSRKTELLKIKEGFGKYFFYSFRGNSDNYIAQWIILDIDILRYFLLDIQGDYIRIKEKRNYSGELFLPINIDELKEFNKDIIVDCSDHYNNLFRPYRK